LSIFALQKNAPDIDDEALKYSSASMLGPLERDCWTNYKKMD
jgi:hypothetical protein